MPETPDSVPKGWPPEGRPRMPIQRNRKVESIILLVLLLLVLISAGSSFFYVVEADSVGVVLRFGEYSRTAQPGLHFKVAWPVEEVYPVPIRQIQSVEFGFTTTHVSRRSSFETTPMDIDVARMLTGDLNLVHVEWIVQYRIDNAKNFLFKVGGTDNANVDIRDLIVDTSESVMRKLVGDRSVDEVITTGRAEVASAGREEIQQVLRNFEAGVEIVNVKLQAASAPEPVRDAFDAVNRAKQNMERVINEARGEQNRQLPAAKGQRDRAILEAEGYQELVVQEAQGRANAFLSQLEEYQKAPEITRGRLFLETIEEVLSQVKDKVIVDESLEGILPLLNVDQGGGQ